MDLKITRALWIHGEGDSGNSKLLRTGDGHMCCLGFFLKACGVSDDFLLDTEHPDILMEIVRQQDEEDDDNYEPFPKQAKWLLNEKGNDNSDVCWDMMSVNDDDKVPEGEREKILAEKFAENGVNVTFED